MKQIFIVAADDTNEFGLVTNEKNRKQARRKVMKILKKYSWPGTHFSELRVGIPTMWKNPVKTKNPLKNFVMPGVLVVNNDSLLKKHGLALRVKSGEPIEVIDNRMKVKANKKRILAYLADLESNPGYPGVAVAAKIKRAVTN